MRDNVPSVSVGTALSSPPISRSALDQPSFYATVGMHSSITTAVASVAGQNLASLDSPRTETVISPRTLALFEAGEDGFCSPFDEKSKRQAACLGVDLLDQNLYQEDQRISDKWGVDLLTLERYDEADALLRGHRHVVEINLNKPNPELEASNGASIGYCINDSRS